MWPALRVGHATRAGGGWLTGTTVVLAPEGGAVAAVDVRGGGPGTRETDALDPRNLVQRVEAVVLTGGSAYGLDSASGVMAWLEERGRGVRVGPDPAHVVPVVPAACVFDLGRGGDFRARPDAATGRAAVEAAAASGPGAPVPEGCVGAGTGAVVGQLKGGVGTASARARLGDHGGRAGGGQRGGFGGGSARRGCCTGSTVPGSVWRIRRPRSTRRRGGGWRESRRRRKRPGGLRREHHPRRGRHRRRAHPGPGAEARGHGARRHRARRAAGASAQRRRHGVHPGDGAPAAGVGEPPRAQRGPRGGRGRGDPRDREGGAGGPERSTGRAARSSPTPTCTGRGRTAGPRRRPPGARGTGEGARGRPTRNLGKGVHPQPPEMRREQTGNLSQAPYVFPNPGHDVRPRDYVKHAPSNTRRRPGDTTLSDPYETTEQHLDRLLRRALNSFDLPDSTVDRLGSALAHSSSLHSRTTAPSCTGRPTATPTCSPTAPRDPVGAGARRRPGRAGPPPPRAVRRRGRRPYRRGPAGRELLGRPRPSATRAAGATWRS